MEWKTSLMYGFGTVTYTAKLHQSCFIIFYMIVNGELVQHYKALLDDAQVIKVQFKYFVATENIL